METGVCESTRAERIAIIHDIETLLEYLQISNVNFVPIHGIDNTVRKMCMDTSFTLRDVDSGEALTLAPVHLATIVAQLKQTTDTDAFSNIWERVTVSVETYYHDKRKVNEAK